MTASSNYKIDNWRDPEMLFDEEYQPFDLVRDLNGYATSDFDLFDNEFSTHHIDERMPTFIDEEKEDVKGEADESTQEIWNLNTISSEDVQSHDCVNLPVSEVEAPYQIATGNSDLVKIRHIYEDGPMIFVSKKRLNRIISQRRKRLEFLKRMPEYRLPYKNRSKGIKYKTRSKMAKDRARNSLGKFSSFKNKKSESIFELGASEIISENKTKKKRPV